MSHHHENHHEEPQKVNYLFRLSMALLFAVAVGGFLRVVIGAPSVTNYHSSHEFHEANLEVVNQQCLWGHEDACCETPKDKCEEEHGNESHQCTDTCGDKCKETCGDVCTGKCEEKTSETKETHHK